METMQHSDIPGMGPATTLDDDLKRIREAKYDYGLESSVCTWIGEIIGIYKPANESAAKWMKSGDIVCTLMNAIRPGTIKKYNVDTTSRFKQMENITLFLRACREVGMLEKDLFSTIDLFEEKDMNSVILCLFNLGGTIQSTIPYFTGPKLGIKQNRKFQVVPQLIFTKPAPPKPVAPVVIASPPKPLVIASPEKAPHRLSLPTVEPIPAEPVLIDVVEPIPLPFEARDPVPALSVAAVLRKPQPETFTPPQQPEAPRVAKSEQQEVPSVVEVDILPRKRGPLSKRVAAHSFAPNMNPIAPNVVQMGQSMGRIGQMGGQMGPLFPSAFVAPPMVQPALGPYQGYGSNLLRQVSSSHQVQYAHVAPLAALYSAGQSGAPRQYLIPMDEGPDLDRCVLEWVSAVLGVATTRLDAELLGRLANAILAVSPNPNIRLGTQSRLVEVARLLGVAESDLGSSSKNVFALGGVLQNYEWWVNSGYPQLGRRIKITKTTHN